MSTSSSVVFIDQASHSGRVMLKVVPVHLYNGKKTLDTYAVLDNGSERTVILPAAVRHLRLMGKQEILSLRTIRQEIVQLKGATVSFKVSTMTKEGRKHDIHHAVTASELNAVRTGLIGGPVAECTALGWAVQGLASFLHRSSGESSCLHL